VPTPDVAKTRSRSAPPLAEGRRMLDRYRRATETTQPRNGRRRTDGRPTLRGRRRDGS